MLRQFIFSVILLSMAAVAALCAPAAFFDDFNTSVGGTAASLSAGAAVQVGAGNLNLGLWDGVPPLAKCSDGVITISGPEGGGRMTTVDKFRNGKYTVRFKVHGMASGNYLYLGFFNRKTWATDTVMGMLDGNRIVFHVSSKGKNQQPCQTPVVTPDEWHTIVLDWNNTSIDMIYDGVSCGRFSDVPAIPSVFVQGIIDVAQTSSTAMTVDVDYVRIEGGDSIIVDRTGYDAVRPPLRTPPATKDIVWPKPTAAEVKSNATGAVIENALYTAEISWKDTLKISVLTNKATGLSCIADGGFSELFSISGADSVIRSSDFMVTSSEAKKNRNGSKLNLKIASIDKKWTADLSILADSTPEMRINMSIKNAGQASANAAIYWPHLSGLQIGDTPSDNYYMFPWKTGWCQNRPTELGSMYGLSSGLMQLFTLFNPSTGSSVYTYLKDNSGLVKTCMLKKLDHPDSEVPSYVPTYPELRPKEGDIPNIFGTQFAMRFLPVEIKPGDEKVLPELVLAIGLGDWHQSLGSYSKWVHSWFKAPKIPEWYKALFETVAVHDTLGNSGFKKGFLKDGQWGLSDQARKDDGLLEVVAWWNHYNSDGIHPEIVTKPAWFKHTTGLYDYWDELGGLSRFRKEIQGCHDKGVRVTLYTTPRFAWQFSDVAKANPDWVLKNADGSISSDWSVLTDNMTSYLYDMCYSMPGWRDFVANTVGRLVKETGCDGVFMDTMNEAKLCYNPAHKHTDSSIILAEKMLIAQRKALKAANPEAIMSAEDACAERLLQYEDGCLLKAFDGTQPIFTDHDLYSVYFFRFYFPEIKYVEWGSIFEHGARRALFNGVGYMRGDLNDTTDPFTGNKITAQDQYEYLTKITKLMSENADAFHSQKPEALVPTLIYGVYANKFPGKGQTIWTFYNKTGKDISDSVIEIDHVAGATYTDLMHNTVIVPQINGKRAILKLNMENGEVTAVAQRVQGYKKR